MSSTISKEQIAQLVGKPDPVIVEIGCNDGTHTQWFLEIFSNPVVHCFEPDPRACRRFAESLGNRPNVHLSMLAVSDKLGRIAFHQSGGRQRKLQSGELVEWDMSGSIKAPKKHLIYHPSITFDSTIEVETTTLDIWHERSGVDVIDFIWMDVQGAESEVFRGGARALSRARFLYTEYSDHEIYEGQPTLAQIENQLQGFKIVSIFPFDVLLANTSMQ
jgi:2-O-methyltransferase